MPNTEQNQTSPKKLSNLKLNVIAIALAVGVTSTFCYALNNDEGGPIKVTPIVADDVSSEQEPTQKIFSNETEKVSPKQQLFSGRADEAFLKAVEDKLNVSVYNHYKLKKQKDLVIVFANEGVFFVNKDVTLAFKGKAIDLDSGDNVIQTVFDQHRDEINSNIKKANDIKAFVSSDDESRKKIASTQKPNLNPPTPTPSNQTLSKKKAEIIANSPGMQYLAQKKAEEKERLKQEAFIREAYERAKQLRADRETKTIPAAQGANNQIAVKHIPTPQGAAAEQPSLLNQLKSLPHSERQAKGPTFAPKILPNIPDDNFVVYENDPSVPYKGTLTIATDYTCAFCRHAHTIIPQLNKEGVKVRYMPYPRSAINDYEHQQGFTTDEYLARIISEPLNTMGTTVAKAYCSVDRKSEYDNLFKFGRGTNTSQEITKACEDKIKEFKIIGDLMFMGATPYLVWGDANTPESQRGFIRGIYKTERSIDALLKRLEK